MRRNANPAAVVHTAARAPPTPANARDDARRARRRARARRRRVRARARRDDESPLPRRRGFAVARRAPDATTRATRARRRRRAGRASRRAPRARTTTRAIARARDGAAARDAYPRGARASAADAMAMPARERDDANAYFRAGDVSLDGPIPPPPRTSDLRDVLPYLVRGVAVEAGHGVAVVRGFDVFSDSEELWIGGAGACLRLRSIIARRRRRRRGWRRRKRPRRRRRRWWFRGAEGD